MPPAGFEGIQEWEKCLASVIAFKALSSRHANIPLFTSFLNEGLNKCGLADSSFPGDGSEHLW
jgi:hypothetical protein